MIRSESLTTGSLEAPGIDPNGTWIIAVHHFDTPASLNDTRAARLAVGVLFEVGRGMKDGAPIELLKRQIAC